MTTELNHILQAHAKKYPLMAPCDAVKLIYQNEFGGGHLVTDSARSLAPMMEPPLFGRRSETGWSGSCWGRCIPTNTPSKP